MDKLTITVVVVVAIKIVVGGAQSTLNTAYDISSTILFVVAVYSVAFRELVEFEETAVV